MKITKIWKTLISLSASQYEIQRQLFRQGCDIRDEYFLWICRKLIRSIKDLFQNIEEQFARFREYQEKKKIWFENTEELTPKYIKDQIRTGG